MTKSDEFDKQEAMADSRQKLLKLRNRIDALLNDANGMNPISPGEIDLIEDESNKIQEQLVSGVPLRKEEDFFEMLTNLRQGIIGVVNERYETEFIRGRGLEPLDLEAEALVGKVLPDVNPSQKERTKLINAFDNSLRGKHQEFKIQYKDHYYQMHTMPVQNPDSYQKKVMFLCWDITTEKVGDLKLQTALDASGVIIAEYDFSKQQFRPNRALFQLVGWPEDKPMCMDDFISYYHPEDRERRFKQIENGHSIGTLNYDARIETPTGMKWIRVVGNVISNDYDKPALGVAAILDITKDKELIEKARMSEERFRLIADSAPVMIWMCNDDKESTYLNPKWLEFTGRKQEEDLGDGWLDHLHPDEREDFLRYRDEAFKKKESFTAELRFQRKDGEYRWLLNNGIPMFNSEGTFLGFIGSCIDITTQKDLAEELEKRVADRTKQLAHTNKELEDLNLHLEEYAHAASHDLQEPLRKIEMFLSIAQDTSSDPQRSNMYLSKVRETATRMRELVKDILSFSSIGNSSNKFTEVDLDLLLEELAQDFELLIKESKAKLRRQKLGVIWGDKVKLNQLFSNLLKNALTYTRSTPEIEIGICEPPVSGEMDGNTVVKDGIHYKCISVKDNGIGFEPTMADTILKPFQRLNSRDKYPGTGLGLSIVNRIVDLHQGYMDIQSEPDKGSEFKVYLPVVSNAS